MVNKIFGIGLSKTGTASLTSALNLLGFNSVHWGYTNETIGYINGSLYLCPDKFKNYEAFTDTPIARIYKELDKLFPNSKFIYTYREINDWIKSCRRFFRLDITKDQLAKRYKSISKRDNLMLDLYGCIQFNEEKFIQAYKNHESEVSEYFCNRKDDFLAIDICSSLSKDNWEKLCMFLGKKIPKDDFPKENVKNYSS